jgi:hypothetical protein
MSFKTDWRLAKQSANGQIKSDESAYLVSYGPEGQRVCWDGLSGESKERGFFPSVLTL